MPFARTTLDNILNVFKGASWSAKTTLYVTLTTSQPSDNTGTGLVEVAAGTGASQWTGYARVAVTTASGWNAITGTTTRSITNAGIIDFGTATISSGTITVTGYAIYDAATVGNLVAYGTLTNGNMVVNSTDSVSFSVGALTVSES